jgi:hypothetical protein
MAQLTAELQCIPTSDALLLQWWPGFKTRMLTAAIAVRKQWVKDVQPPSFKQAREQVTAAVERLGLASGQQQTNAALDAVALAQLQLRNLQQGAWQHSWRAQRQQWVHQGEQPNPAITQQLNALGGSHQQHVIGLRSAAGTFVWEGAGPADIAIAQWAGVSRQPTVDPAAQTQVLAAVRNLPRHPANANGSPTVSVAEVRRALSSSKPGKSPGLDGLPVVFYKYCLEPMLPVLARVFTAIGNLASTPAGFLDGVIVGIFKEGTNDPTIAASYRPITLLNIDYRLLAKIMAERLQVVLDKAISPTQTAFVRGRRIGHNIITAQLLMHALPDDSQLVAALLDFSKAYDTIHRPFLLSVMAAMGVGPDYCQWVATLLSHTCACGYVNGFTSRQLEFFAGVRQGCPLSPVLYLFVAEALLRFLKAKGVKATVHGVDLTATQFADDTEAFLDSPAAVPGFIGVMHTFGNASGQQLNMQKSELLLLGKQARQQHDQLLSRHVSGTLALRPVLKARVLGVMVGSDFDGHLSTQELHEIEAQRWSFWRQHVDKVKAALKRLAHLSTLSIFGRGLGSAAYGISKLLFAAEFSDLPPDQLIAELTAVIAKLVDRGLPPDSHERAFAGVEQHLLAGSPADGGFGTLAWREHILGRHAWWGAQFTTAPTATDIPWIRIGRAVLRSKRSWWGPLACFDAAPDQQTPIPPINNIPHQACLPPQPLRRMIAGLQALGHVCDLPSMQHAQQQQQQQQSAQQQPQQQQQQQIPQPAPQPLTAVDIEDVNVLQQHYGDLAKQPTLTPGAWCVLAPIFGNHFLPCNIPGLVPAGLQTVDPPPVQGLHTRGGYIAGHIRTLGDFYRCVRVISRAVTRNEPHPLSPEDPSDAAGEMAYIQQLVAQIPVTWSQATLGALHLAPIPAVGQSDPVTIPSPPIEPSRAEQWVEAMLVSRLGWQGLPGGKTVGIKHLTVKAATALQLRPVRAERRARHESFVKFALGPSNPDNVKRGLTTLRACLRKLWKRIKWDNMYKEVYWRMAVNGLPTAARMHHNHSKCLCGSLCPGIQHHFWDCPIAQGVVQAVLTQLPPAWCSRPPGVPPLKQEHIWLMQPPAGPSRLHRMTWLVVCLAAINAMDTGRKAVNKFLQRVHIQQSQAAAAARAAVPAVPDDQLDITDYLQPMPLSAAQQQHNQVVEQHRQQRQQQVEEEQQQEAARLLAQAKQLAVAEFWKLVADFVILNPVPVHALEDLPQIHPFICVDAATNLVRLAPRHV